MHDNKEKKSSPEVMGAVLVVGYARSNDIRAIVGYQYIEKAFENSVFLYHSD